MEKNTKSANMHIRVNPDVKEKAMVVLNEMGISASELFNMLLNQVAIQQRIPFELVSSKYVCTHEYSHDWTNMKPDDEDAVGIKFDNWSEAKEWLLAETDSNDAI
ncbi:MAG: type II toxin-antitoxin system RelB/DinJ family antitoxin [Oscillospiraceae bacterium]|nr:type II toxin-antitoxin system RelB/DinJ family antitoxin [Oscillospiraceae bacterium]